MYKPFKLLPKYEISLQFTRDEIDNKQPTPKRKQKNVKGQSKQSYLVGFMEYKFK